MLLVVATSQSPEDIEVLAARTVGLLPAGEAPPPPPEAPSLTTTLRDGISSSDPLPSEVEGLALPDSTLLRVRKIGAKQAAITWVRPLGTVPIEAIPSMEVWNASLSNRIQFQLREREGLAYSIGSSVERQDDGTLLWIASAGTAVESVPRVLEGFREELQKALARAPDDAEVRKQGAQLYGRSLMRRATRMNRAYAAGLAILGGRDPNAIDAEIRSPMGVTSEGVAGPIRSLHTLGPGLVTIVY